MKHLQLSTSLPCHALVAVLGLTLAAPTGCGGLTPLGPKDDTEEQVDIEDEDDPPQIDNCPDLCADAFDTYAPLGCDVSCDIDLGTTIDAGLDVAVINLLTLVWVDIDGEVQTGETCDVVIECPDLTECHSLALICLGDSNSTPEYCISEYLQCEQETMCNQIFMECTDLAWAEYQDCTGTPDQCLTLFDELNAICSEQYSDCLGVGDEPAPLPPAPLMTAPGRFDVSRDFIRYHLDRLATLDAETFTMMMPRPKGAPAGLALRSISPGDTLDQLGLREGDLIVAVNDASIMSYGENPVSLLGLVAGGGVKLTIRRNGTRRELRYRFVD